MRLRLALGAMVAALFLLPGCTRKSATPELRVFTWSEYFDDDFLRAFGEKNHVQVKADYFSSNEEMLAKLQITGAGSGYDLILPSDYMVRTLIELKLVKPLDHAKLPVLADFSPDALNPEYDPGLKFSVPLAIGTTGIAVNTKLLPNAPAALSWKDALENPAYQGKVTLLDDAKEVLQVALVIHGKDLSSATEADVKEAFAYLRAHKAQIKGFPPETRPVIEADECSLCMAYSGDALSVAKEKKEIRFTVPTDGATVWTDNLAIPANAKNPGMAYRFIDELLSVDGAKSFTLRTNYRTANKKAKAALPKEVSGDTAIYPTPAERSRMHYLMQRKDLALLIDKEWALLKSQ
jgi:spermidine/putrescine transport system substrate-binding protein